MEEDLNNNIEDEYSIELESMGEYDSEDSMLPNVSEETKQFLEFIQSVKDDNISHVENLAIENLAKLEKCNFFFFKISHCEEGSRGHLCDSLCGTIWQY